MPTVNLSFPDSSYSALNKPSITTLKDDLTALEAAINALTNDNIAAGAGIEYSKLSIQTGDIALAKIVPFLQSGRTIDAVSDRTIASATPAAVGPHSVSVTVYGTSDVIYCSFLMGFFSNDTTSYYNFSIGYDATSRIQAGSQVSFNGGAGEGNRKIIAITDVITGLAAGTYAIKPFWSRTSGTGTGTCIKDTSVFSVMAIRGA